MKKLLFLLILVLFTISPCLAIDLSKYKLNSVKNGYDLYDTSTYFGYTGKQITFAWDPNPEPDVVGYNIKVYLVEQERYVALGHVSSPTVTFRYTPTIGGHYAFEVQAVDSSGNTSNYTCSLDKTNATVNGTNKGWWVYVHVAPPGGIIID